MAKKELAQAFLAKYYGGAASSTVDEKCSGSCDHNAKCSGDCSHHT